MTDEWPVRSHAQPVMGTVVSIAARPPSGLAPPELDAALAAAVAELHRADEDFSTFKERSWVSRLRRGEIGLADCPGHVRDVYRLAEACRDRSSGWFDPAWRGDGTLDPTGLVKGWAAGVASAALRAAGVPDHCVNAAGDLCLRGERAPGRAWRVGIADPFDRGGLVAVVEGTDLAVATSGVAERGDHVRDPHTGAPAAGLAAVTVVGPDLALADAYATAGLAAGRNAPELLRDLARDGWDWLTVDTAGRVRISAGFRDLGGQTGQSAIARFDYPGRAAAPALPTATTLPTVGGRPALGPETPAAMRG